MRQKIYKSAFTILSLAGLIYLGYKLNLPEQRGRCIPEELSMLAIFLLCRFIMDPDVFTYSLRGNRTRVIEKMEKRVGFEYQMTMLPNARISREKKAYQVVAGHGWAGACNGNFLSLATGVYDITIEADHMKLVRKNSTGRIFGNLIYTINLSMIALLVNIGWNDYMAGDMNNATAIPILLLILEVIFIFGLLGPYFFYPGITVRKYMKEIIDLAEEENNSKKVTKKLQKNQ